MIYKNWNSDILGTRAQRWISKSCDSLQPRWILIKLASMTGAGCSRWTIWNDVRGRLVNTIDPTMLIEKPGEAIYLFQSISLLVLADSLYHHLLPNDISHIPAIKRTPHFPYWLPGKACFLVRGDEDDLPVSGEGSICSKCGPRTGIDRSNAQRILEHMGGHILHDQTISRSQELCGLCLCPVGISWRKDVVDCEGIQSISNDRVVLTWWDVKMRALRHHQRVHHVRISQSYVLYAVPNPLQSGHAASILISATTMSLYQLTSL